MQLHTLNKIMRVTTIQRIIAATQEVNKITHSRSTRVIFINSSTLQKRMEKQKILITGASSGIGREIAYHFARDKNHLILTYNKGKEEGMEKIHPK